MIGILFVVSLVGIGIFMAKYVRVLTAIVDRSNESGVEIFGARYKSIYSLMADINFLNTLWGKGCHEQIADAQLSELVAKAHRMLRAMMIVGIFVFFIPLINAVINIGG